VRIYLDHNASAPLDPRVARAMAEAAAAPSGNPSSIHAEGRAARDALEAARRAVAALIGAAPADLVFTAGGTEADLLGVTGLARLAAATRVVTSGVEHPAVLGAAAALATAGVGTVRVAIDGEGRLDPAAVAEACAGATAVVTVQLANHELGTVQEVAAIAAAARAAGARVHCDAVQAAGKLPIDVAALGADTVALSAHKIAGPQGIGALWVAPGLDLAPLAPAGHQERGRRPGTENLLGAIGFAAAAAIAAAEGPGSAARVRQLAAELEAGLRGLGARIHGAGAPRVGNTVNAGFAGAPGEVVVAALDLAGVAVSTGAACTSGTVAPSPVLLALGLDPRAAAEAVRFSLGPGNTADEVHRVLELLPDIVARARRFSGT